MKKNTDDKKGGAKPQAEKKDTKPQQAPAATKGKK